MHVGEEVKPAQSAPPPQIVRPPDSTPHGSFACAMANGLHTFVVGSQYENSHTFSLGSHASPIPSSAAQTAPSQRYVEQSLGAVHGSPTAPRHFEVGPETKQTWVGPQPSAQGRGAQVPQTAWGDETSAPQ